MTSGRKNSFGKKLPPTSQSESALYHKAFWVNVERGSGGGGGGGEGAKKKAGGVKGLTSDKKDRCHAGELYGER